MLDSRPESKNSTLSSTLEDSNELLKIWRNERAARVVKGLAPVGTALSLLTTIIDISFQVPWGTLLGDFGLLAGCFTSLIYSRKPSAPMKMVWGPMYFGVWIGCSTALWVTGGLHSPLLGAFLSLLCVSGLVMQAEVKPVWVIGFISLNLLFWVIDDAAGLSSEVIAPESLFVTFINLVALSAILICVFQFLRTERVLAQEVLKRYDEAAKARSELAREEAASSAKSTFLANISHELRTPLGAILGFAELLQDPQVSSEERLQFTETILRNGQALARLVNDILDLSKIEAGKIEVERVPVDPQAIVMDVVNLFSISAQKKGLEIHVHQLDGLPQNIVSDPLRFQQILNNMIGNAIKFTENGSIEIRASLSEKDLRIEVADSGRGLTLEEQQKLFKPFSQAAADISRIYGGTGLGLNLSRSLAKLLGGDLKLVWSQAGEGSCFVFIHPLAPHRVG